MAIGSNSSSSSKSSSVTQNLQTAGSGIGTVTLGNVGNYFGKQFGDKNLAKNDFAKPAIALAIAAVVVAFVWKRG